MKKNDMKKGLALVFAGSGAAARSEGEPAQIESPQTLPSAVQSADQQPEKLIVPEPEKKTVTLKKAVPQKTVRKAATGEGAKKTASKAKTAKEVKAPPAAPAAPPVKEHKVAFNLQMPESLHARFSYYADNFAVGRNSSITKLVLEGAEKHLLELEKKAGII